MEREEQAKKRYKPDEHTIYIGQEFDDDSEQAGLKLTRAKAKELNKLPLPLVPLKHTQPDSEVIALIRDDLQSDDEDEEYQPGEDDIEVIIYLINHFVENFYKNILNYDNFSLTTI